MYLEIKQLTKRYGSRTVVSQIDLTMAEGEILSLLGPSGCGKTTILRMIAGLIRPDGGYIRVGDKVFYDGKRELPVERRDLGMVFQDFALWPHMTVAQNVAFGLRLRRQPAKLIADRVQELLTLVNLPGYGNRFPHQLSGGQQQRVAVARALATSPSVLLLDEPLSSLDTGLRAAMREELVQLFKRLKITAINVTHDQDEATMMSDRIMVLRDGHIQQIGSPTELYLEPENAFVAGFIGQANLLNGQRMSADAAGDQVNVLLDSGDADVPRSGWVMTSAVSPSVRPRLNGRVNVLCRPDNVRVYPDAQGNVPNRLSGTVEHTSFVAGRWRTLIQVTGQPQRMLTYPSFTPTIGQTVWLELPAQDCRVLPSD